MARSRLKLVLDSTPLIYLARTSLLEATCRSFEIYVSEAVRRETTEKTEYSDALIIKDLIEKELIRVVQVEREGKTDAFRRHPEIHPGEAETLAAAQELGATAIIDDAEARALAKLYGVKASPGTLSLLFLLVANGTISPGAAEGKLDEMIDAGLYLDSRTLLAAKRRLRDAAGKP